MSPSASVKYHRLTEDGIQMPAAVSLSAARNPYFRLMLLFSVAIATLYFVRSVAFPVESDIKYSGETYQLLKSFRESVQLQLLEMEERERDLMRQLQDQTLNPTPSASSDLAGRPAHFPRRPEVEGIDCARLFAGDKEYQKKIASTRPKLIRSKQVNLCCEAIRARVLPPRNANAGFPIAFAKVVNTDYEFLEEQLAITYSSENWYCFAPDKKSTVFFRRHITALSACLPNVLLSESEYDTDSAGHFANHAHFDCLRQLAAKPWRYVILLQNHDVVMKSNAELVRVFQLMNGSNDWEMMFCPGRCPSSLEHNLGKLGMCPTGFPPNERKKCESASLTWGKGSVQVSLAWETVNFLLTRINYSKLLEQFNKEGYGVDEMLVQTIALTPELRLPGGFTSKCLVNGNQHVSRHLSVTRLTHWSHADNVCGSRKWRHAICVFGVEDLPYLAESAYLTANKLMPDSDYAAIACLGELLFNRSIGGLQSHPLKENIYTNLPQVRFDRERAANPNFDLKNFSCEVPLS